MAKTDPDQVLRQLPLVAGILGSSLLLTNRWLTPDLTNSQSRSDVLGVILSALLILTGLIWQRVQPQSPDAVTLIGKEGFELMPNLPDVVKTELAWASHILLTNTVTRSLVVWYDGQILLRRGILAAKTELQPGPILQRVLEKQKPVYLVSLAIYPGRVEFDYLPENTQGVICQPIGNRGALILAARAPRSYTRQDETWVEAIASKLEDTLSRYAADLNQPVSPQIKEAEPD
jgi:Cofactor assembly of complex C subunit B, CCB2/CCB4